MAFEEEFGVEIPDDAAEKISTVSPTRSSTSTKTRADAQASGLDRRVPAPIGAGRRSQSTGSARKGLGLLQFLEKCMRRVVVTGLGLVTPLGGRRNHLGEPDRRQVGAGRITRFDTTEQKCHIACEVKPADHPYGFDPNKRVDHKVQRQVDPFIIYGIDAAGQALEDAGLTEMIRI
jgi:hypothetical protein